LAAYPTFHVLFLCTAFPVVILMAALDWISYKNEVFTQVAAGFVLLLTTLLVAPMLRGVLIAMAGEHLDSDFRDAGAPCPMVRSR
jgi:hypothetical protein